MPWLLELTLKETTWRYRFRTEDKVVAGTPEFLPFQPTVEKFRQIFFPLCNLAFSIAF